MHPEGRYASRGHGYSNSREGRSSRSRSSSSSSQALGSIPARSPIRSQPLLLIALALVIPVGSFYLMHTRLVDRQMVLEKAILSEARQVSELRQEVRELNDIKHQLVLATKAMARSLRADGKGSYLEGQQQQQQLAAPRMKVVSAAQQKADYPSTRGMRGTDSSSGGGGGGGGGGAGYVDTGSVPPLEKGGDPYSMPQEERPVGGGGGSPDYANTQLNPMQLRDDDIYGQAGAQHPRLQLPGSPTAGCDPEFWNAAIPGVYQNLFRWKQEPGTFVEVGAGDGIFNSNLWFFEKHLCWSGVAFEPTKNEFPKLKINRPRSVAMNGAVCKEGEASKEFSDVVLNGLWTGWGGFADTFTPAIQAEINDKIENARGWAVNRYTVDCFTLREVMRASKLAHVDFMAVAVQGHELEVLRTMDWKAVEVDVVQVESRHGREGDVEEFMRGQGFQPSVRLLAGHKDAVFVREGFRPLPAPEEA